MNSEASLPSSLTAPSAETLAFAASIEQTSSKPAPSSKERKRCCVKGCKNHVNLQRVPPYPKPLAEGASKDRQITQAKRMLKRQEFLQRLGRNRDDKTKDLRYCGNHRMEHAKFAVTVHVADFRGNATETVNVPLDCMVPINVTTKPAIQGMRKRCCVKGCRNHYSLQRVPPFPKELPLGASKARQLTRAKKFFKRQEFMKRLGYSLAESNKHPDVRFCPNHKMEEKSWTFAVPILDEFGNETETVEETIQFAVPVGIVPSLDEESAAAAAAMPNEALPIQASTAASAFYEPLAASFGDRKEPAQSSIDAAVMGEGPLRTEML